MSWYSIYDKQGKITNTLLVSKGVDLNLNVPDNHSYIEGKYNHSEYYIKDGSPKPYPERPSRFHHFDFTSEEWVEDTASAEKQKRKDVNSERTRRIQSGFKTKLAGHNKDVAVEGGAEARENINALALAALLRKQMGDNSTSIYRDKDNVDHELTPDQLLELYKKSMTYAEKMYQKSWALKAMDPIPQDYKDDKYWR